VSPIPQNLPSVADHKHAVSNRNSPCYFIVSAIFTVSRRRVRLSLEFSLSGLKEIVESPMDPQTQNTSLQRLQNVENVKFWKTHSFLRDFIGRFDVNVFLCFYFWFSGQRVVKVLELAGGVMEELASPSGPKKEFVNSHCREFMQSMKVSYSISSSNIF
jgi:mediator of RNA polymerase II transcription subunit 11